jgi:hypothetical protein
MTVVRGAISTRRTKQPEILCDLAVSELSQMADTMRFRGSSGATMSTTIHRLLPCAARSPLGSTSAKYDMHFPIFIGGFTRPSLKVFGSPHG